jgi:hypothetical protein
MTEQPKPQVLAPALSPRESLAVERAGKDLENASEGARAATQSTILINGGAATAILAYLAKDSQTDSALVTAAAVSLGVYALGVALAALSMWCSSQASAQFGYYWEATLDANKDGEKQYFDAGQIWLTRHRASFLGGILCFMFASYWIASAFWQLHH